MKNILLAAAVLLTAGITGFAQMSEKKAKAATDEIRSVMKQQQEAWNRGDIEGFMKGYWNSPDLVFVSGDNITRGWQPTLDRYKKSYDSRAKMGTLEFSGLNISFLSKDAAVVLGSWSLTRETDNPHGKFTLIFRKMDDGWRIVHDHTS